MAQFIPESIVAEILQAANIISVIGEYVQLKKAGNNHIGLCPFHAEKTPSFSVNENKQMFKCFGCGVGGNVYTFLMRQNNLSFPEAVKLLADRHGIQIPTGHLTAEQKRQLNERDQLFEINQTALIFFQDQLKSPAGQIARKYLAERGLSSDIQKQFSLGYVPEGWDNTVRLFSRKGIALKLVEKAGLIIQKERKGHYDRFRDRIIFPIINVNNQVAGFGGRVLDDTTPKYLNSPETPIYHKSRLLYGLSEAKDHCRKQDHVFIVEGYMDLLALCQYGIPNVVATLGTALTSQHIRLLKGYVKSITLVFDSDQAGIQAAKRSISLFLKEQISAQIMVLPDGYDPDNFLNKWGPDKFIEKSKKSFGMIAFLIDASLKANGDSIKGKIAVINELKPLLSQINDAVVQSLYIKEISELLNIDESAIVSEVHKLQPRITKPQKQLSNKLSPTGAGRQLEKQVIAMMLHCNDIHNYIEAHGILDAFKDHSLQSIGSLILQQPSPFDPNQLINHVDSQEQQDLIVSLSLIEQEFSKQQCLALIHQFERRINANKRHRLLAEIEKAEKKQDLQLVAYLQSQLCNLL
ncbi:DNA primase [Candidatus Magnetomorum sp. HK-1]|nr:DNA primase [Candidatus Magnetomorum sp. HK-1]